MNISKDPLKDMKSEPSRTQDKKSNEYGLLYWSTFCESNLGHDKRSYILSRLHTISTLVKRSGKEETCRNCDH